MRASAPCWSQLGLSCAQELLWEASPAQARGLLLHLPLPFRSHTAGVIRAAPAPHTQHARHGGAGPRGAQPSLTQAFSQGWEKGKRQGLGERRTQLPAPPGSPDCWLTRFPCDPLRGWLRPEPSGSAPASAQRAGVCRRVCVAEGWGATREPAVGPLTSFQSLPFINIYSSSPTKNNILEPREQKKKINENHRELGLIIMCAGAEWKPAQGRGGASTAPGGSALPLAVTGQRAPPGRPRAVRRRTDRLPRPGEGASGALCLLGALCSPFPPPAEAAEQRHHPERAEASPVREKGRRLFLALWPGCECL